mgnify:CR=1 FL=1
MGRARQHRASRRSISNIIGAIMLVAITIVGGFMVYNYFNKSMTSFMSLGNSVVVSASEAPASASNESIIYVKVTNNEGADINVTGIYLVGPGGKPFAINASNVNELIDKGVVVSVEPYGAGALGIVNAVISPTRSAEGVYVVKGYYTSVFVQYEAGGSVYYTQPVSLG